MIAIGLLIRRWLAFNLIGLLGIVVQMLALFALRDRAGIHYLTATALAVEAAVLHNFAWHESWTWADRSRVDPAGALGRLMRFNMTTGAISIGCNLVLMALLVGALEMHYIAANLITILACSAFNFLASDRLVFKRPRTIHTPSALAALAQPVISAIARESLSRTLSAVRDRSAASRL